MRPITLTSLALVAALWATGLLTHTPVRHLIQTLPIWLAVALAARGVHAAKWMALAFSCFWLAMQGVTWLYASALVSAGDILSWDLALSAVIALAALAAIAACLRFRSDVGWLAGFAIFGIAGFVQLAAFLTSVLPSLAYH